MIAYEDIGLANPDAQIHTVTALDAAQRIGFPEARILIANVVIDLALSPKSNSAITAIDKAISDLHQNGNLPIPRHLRDGHYAGSKDLGNAQGYKYPHDYPEKWVKQQYLPDKLVEKIILMLTKLGNTSVPSVLTKSELMNCLNNDNMVLSHFNSFH